MATIMPIPSEVRLRCERLFFALVFCDDEQTNGETISCVLGAEREARVLPNSTRDV